MVSTLDLGPLGLNDSERILVPDGRPGRQAAAAAGHVLLGKLSGGSKGGTKVGGLKDP